MPLGLREIVRNSTDIVTAMAAYGGRSSVDPDDEADYLPQDTSVDPRPAYPTLPPIGRRNSEVLSRTASVVSSDGKLSLPDLTKIQSSFASVSFWEGSTDPDIILKILEIHPDIDCIYMSPTLPPSDENYSAYAMHMVSPGCVDVMNYCAIGRKFVMRYIKGKQPHKMTLKRWAFEQKTITKLRDNKFFKNFRLIKAFSALGRSLDMRNFGKTCRRLRTHLLSCDPNYADALLLVRTMCVDISALSMIHVDVELTYTLGEFLDDQEHHTSEVTAKIERYLHMLLQLTSRTCWDDVIHAGLAVEREGRKGSAPKRINELRKMQRMKQSPSGNVSRGSPDDVNIGTWIWTRDNAASLELEEARLERCNRLSRLIYLIDCIMRATLHGLYINSLSSTADYMGLQVGTFPSEEEIKNIVKGYIGDLDISGTGYDDDDDDDNKPGGGVGGNSGDHSGDNNKENNKKDNEKHHKGRTDTRYHGGPTQTTVARDPGSGQRPPAYNQTNYQETLGILAEAETEASATSETHLFSTAPGTNGYIADSDGIGSQSTLDDADHIPAQGSSDSLDTTSSTLSDERDSNSMGNFGSYTLQPDDNFIDIDQSMDFGDQNLGLMVGQDIWVHRVHQEQVPDRVFDIGSGLPSLAENEMENDEVTVIERLSEGYQSQTSLALDKTADISEGSKSDAKSQDISVQETSADLTITSDEASSFHRRDETAHAKVFSSSSEGTTERSVQKVNKFRPSSDQISSPNSNTDNSLSVVSCRETSVDPVGSSQHNKRIYTCFLTTTKSGQPLSNDISESSDPDMSIRKLLKEGRRSISLSQLTDYIAAQSIRSAVNARRGSGSFADHLRRSMTLTSKADVFSPKGKGKRSGKKDSPVRLGKIRRKPPPKISYLAKLFNSFFNQVLDSPVDLCSDDTEQGNYYLDFPILDGTIWISEDVWGNMRVRSTRESSVDGNEFMHFPTTSDVPDGPDSRDGSEVDKHPAPNVQLGEASQKQEADESIGEISPTSSADVSLKSENSKRNNKNQNVCQNSPSDKMLAGKSEVSTAKHTRKYDRRLQEETEKRIASTYCRDIIESSWAQAHQAAVTEDETNDLSFFLGGEVEEYDIADLNANTSPERSFASGGGVSSRAEDFFKEEYVNDMNDTDQAFNQAVLSSCSTPVEEEHTIDPALRGIRKDGGRRKKCGKPVKDSLEVSHDFPGFIHDKQNIKHTLSGSVTPSDHLECITEYNEEQNPLIQCCIDDSDSSVAHGSEQKRANLSLTSSPVTLSESSSSSKTLRQHRTLDIHDTSVWTKLEQWRERRALESFHRSALNAHGGQFNSPAPSFWWSDSPMSSTSTRSLTSLLEATAEDDQEYNKAHVTPLYSKSVGVDEDTASDNNTDRDYTDLVFENSQDDSGSSKSYKSHSTVQTVQMDTQHGGVKSHFNVQHTKKHLDLNRSQINVYDDTGEVNEENEDDDAEDGDNGEVRGGGRGGGGGGGSGGGSGGGGPIPFFSRNRRLFQDLKPMFHAALTIENQVVTMTPDVFDFTATAFNIIQDMEERLLSIDSLTAHPAFQTFTRPTKVGQTSIDKKSRGPSLDFVLRKDANLVRVKNSIYGAIDSVFYYAKIYCKQMQRLFTNIFLLPPSDGSSELKTVEYFCQRLQAHDSQLKISDRLPESQRLGMFLIDISLYKEYVRAYSLTGLQHLQHDMNTAAIKRTHALIGMLDELQMILEGHPTTLDALFRRLKTMDTLETVIQQSVNAQILHIASLYEVMDRFDVPHTETERQGFESTHNLVSSVRKVGEKSLLERDSVIQAIEKCLIRDVPWIEHQVSKVLRPLVENSIFLDGQADILLIKQALTQAEQDVRGHVAMANFVREVQRYLEKPESQFEELFQVSSRYVNTRNLWLLMVDWDVKTDKWKNQSFQSLEIQKINYYTFKYMEACDKLEKVIPKNTVVQVFGDKMDVMLRWLNFIIEFRGQAVKARHWRQIEDILGVEFNDEFPLTLGNLMTANALEKQKNLHVILNKARAESNVQAEFDDVRHQISNLKIPIQLRQKTLVEGEEPISVYLLGDTFEVEEALNYCVMELERIDLSPHSGFLHNSLEEFVQRIFESLENLVGWVEMQMKLSRLRRLILRHPDVSETLPNDIAKYKHLYLEYSRFVEEINANPDVMHWCASHDLHEYMEATGDEIVRIYRQCKRDIESRGGQDNARQDAQQQFGTWVIM